MRRHIWSLLLLWAFCTSSVFAQYRFSYLKVGASVGPVQYLGDLDDDFGLFKFTQPGFGALVGYKFNPHMSARLHVFHGWLYGDDRLNTPYPRNRRLLMYRSPLTEISTTVTYDVIGLNRKFGNRVKVNPYLFTGVGLFMFNPQGRLGNTWYDLQPLGTEGQNLPGSQIAPYSLSQVCIPMGGGFHFFLGKNWELDAEIGWRKLFTDYLDDVSGSYPNRAAMLANGGPVALYFSDPSDPTLFPNGLTSIRGDKTQMDWYIYTNLSVSYIIDWVKCPKFK